MPDNSAPKGRVPPEILQVSAAGIGLLVVVATGAGLSSMLPHPPLSMTAAAYLAPAGLAFAAYWWVTQKL